MNTDHEDPSPACTAPLSSVLEARARDLTEERVSIGQLLELLDDRSIWALLLLFSLPMALPIPAPGLSFPFGACMILISVQLAMGRPQVWLPSVLSGRSIESATFAKVVRRMLPTLRRLEKAVRPRKRWMAPDWMRMPVGIVCLVLAVIITLPIPLGHVVPGAAISLFSLGMMERDGIAVWLGLAVAVAGIMLVLLASAGLYGGISHLWKV